MWITNAFQGDFLRIRLYYFSFQFDIKKSIIIYFQADWMCLLANTSNDKPAHLNKSLICLPMKEKGTHFRVISRIFLFC